MNEDESSDLDMVIEHAILRARQLVAIAPGLPPSVHTAIHKLIEAQREMVVRLIRDW